MFRHATRGTLILYTRRLRLLLSNCTYRLIILYIDFFIIFVHSDAVSVRQINIVFHNSGPNLFYAFHSLIFFSLFALLISKVEFLEWKIAILVFYCSFERKSARSTIFEYNNRKLTMCLILFINIFCFKLSIVYLSISLK